MELRAYQQRLIHELVDAWKQGYRRPCIVLPCGGGKSVITADIAKRTTDNGKRVLFLVHRQELCDQIEATFSAYGVNMALCTVGMVQTITRHLAKQAAPDLIITDENHHCLASGYQRVYHHFSGARCVGVTATPVRLNGGGLGDVNDKLLIGPSVKELIGMRCLSPFDYYAPSVADLAGIHTRAGEFVASEVEAALDQSAIYGDVVKYYRELSGGKQAICYCASIRHSQQMARRFRQAGVSAAHIDGSTPKPERAKIVEDFRRGELQILCNVDLISEGFDVPDCTTSILLRPTKSLTLFIQQSMRCMRYKPTKRAVILDHVGNYTRFGLPDTERQWSLEPKRKRPQGERQVKIRECPACYCVHLPSPVCPKCGHVYAPERKSPREIRDAKMRRIGEIVSHYENPKQCVSFTELVAYGKKMRYKPGWAYYQAKKMGLFYERN